MKNKGAINIILLILVVVLAGALVYVLSAKRATAPAEPSSGSISTTPVPTSTVGILPATCVDEGQGDLAGPPVITSISPTSGPIGTKIEIRGCNFSGFEGDKDAWIVSEENSNIGGFLKGEPSLNSKLIVVTLRSPLCMADNSYSGLPCQAYSTLTPGKYKIHTTPWGKQSNEAVFTITAQSSGVSR